MSGTNTLPSGYRLSDFEIVRVLGQGGFGVTYLAYDQVMEKFVAIKEYMPSEWSRRSPDNTVAPISAKSQEFFQWGLERFLDEARTMAKFDHPCIVRATRHFATNGTAYIIMDFVEGETLDLILARSKTLPADQTRYLLEMVLDGLRQTHRLDILHRDIKPSNIIIRSDNGRPVLIDFGAARQAIQKQSAPITAIVSPPYAPNEQYTTQQKRQGPWTDLYSVSVVGYECLTGIKPPDGPGRIEEDTISWLDPNKYDDSELCEAINAGLQVSSLNRPGNIEAWLTISGVHYVPKPDEAGPGQGASAAHTGRRNTLAPEFHTRVRDERSEPKKGKSGGAGKLALAAAGATALVAALLFLAQAKAPSAIPANDSQLPDTFTDQPNAAQMLADMPVMRRINPGSFLMGSSVGDEGHVANEAPAHNVTINYTYAMSETEVTLGQWRACTQNGPCRDIDSLTNENDELLFKNAASAYPARMLLMSDIDVYLQFLSSQTGKTYRLPTEAEWEYAAGAGAKDTAYPWGDEQAFREANCAECSPSNFAPDVYEVKRFDPNPLGLYDMSGNVWEVVSDCWTENFSSSLTDGRASHTSGCTERTVKGGGYLSKLVDMRVATRSKFIVVAGGQEVTNRQVGFRVVREMDE